MSRSQTFNRISQRWLDMMVLGTVAAGMLAIASALSTPLLMQIWSSLSSVGFFPLLWSSTTVTVAVCWLMGRRRWKGWIGLRYLFRYPPLWVASLLAILLLGTLRGFGFDGVSEWVWQASQIAHGLADLSRYQWCMLLVLPLLIGAYEIMGYFCRHKPMPMPAGVQRLIEQIGFDDLLNWVDSGDDPISVASHDFFGHVVVAERIARRLALRPDAPTLALIGERGSGKTSILNIVKQSLESSTQRRVVIVDVSLWQFDTPEAAIGGVLRAITAELSKYVNVLHLLGLPHHYTRALENAPSWLGAISPLLSPVVQPHELLRRIESVAVAIDIAVVVWIEDLDRFAGDGTSSGRDGDERLNPVRGFLHSLDACESVSVVLSDQALRSGFDIDKLARYVEHPPQLSASQAWHIIATFRSGLFNGASFIDPADPELRRELNPHNEPFRMSLWLLAPQGMSPRGAIAYLLRTPRKLKSALRLYREVFEALVGEIDLDDAFVVCALRVARPGIFDRFDVIVRSDDTMHIPGVGKKVAFSEKALKSLEESLAHERDVDRRAIEALVKYLLEARDREDFHRKPQALAQQEYWDKYTALATVSAAENDQAALTSIIAWQEHRSDELLERFLDPSQSDKLLRFRCVMKCDDVLRLLDRCVEVWMGQSAVEWGDRHPHDIWAITILLSMLCGWKKKKLADSVRSYVVRAIRENLPLARSLFEVMCIDHEHTPVCVPHDEAKGIQEAYIKELARAYLPKRAETLLSNLRDGDAYVLYHLCYSYASVRADSTNFEPFAGWRRFARVLIRAARSNREKMLPQLVPFLTTSEPQEEREMTEDGPEVRRSYLVEYCEERGRTLFGRLLPCLLQMFSVTDVPVGVGEQTRDGFTAIRQAARAANENR